MDRSKLAQVLGSKLELAQVLGSKLELVQVLGSKLGPVLVLGNRLVQAVDSKQAREHSMQPRHVCLSSSQQTSVSVRSRHNGNSRQQQECNNLSHGFSPHVG